MIELIQNRISKKSALIIMFFILGLLVIFHFLIISELIPYDFVWAGKINSVEEMRTFETFSILLNLFILFVLSVKYKQLERKKSNKAVDVLIWTFVVLFALNSVGNLFAQSVLELILGTFLTLISCLMCFIVVKKSKEELIQENIK